MIIDRPCGMSIPTANSPQPMISASPPWPRRTSTPTLSAVVRSWRPILPCHLYVSAEGSPDWTYAWPKGARNVTYLRPRRPFQSRQHPAGGRPHPRTHARAPEFSHHRLGRRGHGTDRACHGRLSVRRRRRAPGFCSKRPPATRARCARRRKSWKPPCASASPTSTSFVQILPAHGAGSACGKSLGAVPHFDHGLRAGASTER